MPFEPELHPAREKVTLLHADEDLPKTLLSREAYLIGGGIKDGFLDRLNQAKENPGATALEFTGAVAIGAGLTALSMAGGRWETAARIGTRTLEFAALADGVRRLIPTGYAIGDTMANPEHYLNNRAIVARNLGSACFDYPLMAAGGMIGSAAIGSKAASSMLDKFRTKPEPSPSLTDNPFFDKGQADPFKPFANAKELDPIMTRHPSPGHGSLDFEIGAQKPALVNGEKALRSLAHENPPGAWQQPVPEGSNVNWLNNIPEGAKLTGIPEGAKLTGIPEGAKLTGPPEGAKLTGPLESGAKPIDTSITTNRTPPFAKAHENPPGAWQQPLPPGSNVNWLNNIPPPEGVKLTGAPEGGARPIDTSITPNQTPPFAKAHENPAGAWQQPLPPGSNVNWLTHKMGPLEMHQVTTSNVGDSTFINPSKSLLEILSKYEPKAVMMQSEISVRPLIIPAIWTSWGDDNKLNLEEVNLERK